MSYAGNAKLSQEIQNRIANTFQQTIALVEEGNVQEALLGCDFILRLDPLFEPARKLQERLQEGGADMAVEDLAALAASPLDADLPPLGDEAPEETEDAAPDVEVADQDLTLPDLEAEAVSPPADDLASTFTELFAQREFGQILQLASQHQERLADDADLRDMVDSAQVRLEAEPYVRNFLDSSRQAHQGGDLEKAQSLIAKARELDATHPEILSLESELMPDEISPPEPEMPEPQIAESETGQIEDEASWLNEMSSEPVPPAAFEPPPVDLEVRPAPPPMAPEPEVEPTPQVEIEPPETEPEVESPIPSAETEAVPAETEEEPTPGLADAEPAASLDTDSERRIDDLLKEGQVAFEKGEYQSAIDAWSRIFLIDIDHAEASRRIELARKLKAEVERQIEETFHEGISHFESGDTDSAREAFKKVLEMQPGHIGVTEYLDKLDGAEPAAAPEAGGTPIPALEDLQMGEGEPIEEALPPDEMIDLAPMPEPEVAPMASVAEAPQPVKAARGKRPFMIIGAVVLLAVLAVGWFLYSRRQQVFPNSETEQATAQVERTDPLTKATQLHEAGNTALAIAQLRRLAPDHPQYAQAQTLIAQWEERAVEAEKAEAAEPTEEELANQAELVAAARDAMGRGENLVAAGLLDEAEAIAALGPDDTGLREQIGSRLEVVEDQVKLFRQGDWEYALPNLWRLREEYPSNKDVVQLMVGCYFNLGLRDLQRGDPGTALEKFEEALTLAPDDYELQRLAAFSSAYKQRSSDLLYRVFVKYHPFR